MDRDGIKASLHFTLHLTKGVEIIFEGCTDTSILHYLMGIASSNYSLPDPFSKLYCESLYPFPIKSHILSIPPFSTGPVIYKGKKEESPLAYIESRNVVIDSIKETIDGKGIVVRLYEALGFRTADTLTLSFPYEKVEECNLVEEDRRKLKSLRLEFSPFEIKTLYFTR